MVAVQKILLEPGTLCRLMVNKVHVIIIVVGKEEGSTSIYKCSAVIHEKNEKLPVRRGDMFVMPVEKLRPLWLQPGDKVRKVGTKDLYTVDKIAQRTYNQFGQVDFVYKVDLLHSKGLFKNCTVTLDELSSLNFDLIEPQ